MKKMITTMFALLALASCKQKEATIAVEEPKELAAWTPEMEENAVIYEANIRQYSPEGTFEKFTQDIPQLKELGVKVIWLMPVFPISETKRKATGGADSKFASDMPEAEQSKYLGSYYAVSDFTKINPEFGTIEDFRALVKTAHDNGIYVILDWVPNHTGWDHEWIKSNPDYYTQNEKDEIIHPEGTDWEDVADLNYDNQNMRKEMIEDMQYWLKKESVDGFRCDVAGSVPTDFWAEAIPQLRAVKPVFMLAEAWEPELVKEGLFDMCYAWDGHHLMNGIAKGEKSVADFNAYIEKVNKDYAAEAFLMNFVDNHDENSWNGTIKERMGDGAEAMMALSYMMPGMPLIYSGDEYGLDHRLLFFEKDSIPKTKGKNWAIFAKLGKLKETETALNGGKNAAAFKSFSLENKNVMAFERSKADASLKFLANMSKDALEVEVPFEGTFTDKMTGEKVVLEKGKKISLQPWQYFILGN
jgi:alpha-amylase